MKVLEIGVPKTGKTNQEWIGLDIAKTKGVDIVADIRQPLIMIEDDTFDLIYMSHVLEHVPWFETTKVLAELYRIIAWNGSIEIWVPGFEKLMAAYLNQDGLKDDGWYNDLYGRDVMKWINARLFHGVGEPLESNTWHRACFDYSYLKRCLGAVNFVDVKKLDKPRGVGHGYINLGASGIKKVWFNHEGA